MHLPIPLEIWAKVANIASNYKLVLTSAWGCYDQLVFPGQQLLTVGWGVEGDAPRIEIFVSSGGKYIDAPQGSICVQKSGDWSTPEDEDVAEAMHGLSILVGDLVLEGAYMLQPIPAEYGPARCPRCGGQSELDEDGLANLCDLCKTQG